MNTGDVNEQSDEELTKDNASTQHKVESDPCGLFDTTDKSETESSPKVQFCLRLKREKEREREREGVV